MRLYQSLKSIIDSLGINQSSLAKAIGMSPSVISHYMKNTYKGDVEALEARIREYLSLEKERQASLDPKSGQIVQTKAYKEINALLRNTVRDREMTLIVGKSGTGKTTSLREYHRLHPTSILIEADHGYTARALFVELCEKLGLPTKGNLHDLLTRVVAKLQGSGRLILVDEAEHLPYRALELIRRIHDKAEVGVALVGMERLKANLQGDPNHFAQLYSRIGSYRKIEGLSLPDVSAMVVARLGQQVSDDTLASLAKACRSNARTLVKILRWCVELSRMNNDRAIDAEMVSAAEDLVVIA